MHTWAIVVIVYLLGMVPAIFLARQSIRALYFQEPEKWGWEVWIIFPHNMFRFKFFKNCDLETHPIEDFKLIRKHGEANEINLDQFCKYLIFTMLTWPLRMVYTVLILIAGCLISLGWFIVSKILAFLKIFAKGL